MTPEEMIREHRRRHNVMAGHYWPELASQMTHEIKRLQKALKIIQKENTRARKEFTNVSNKLIDDAIKDALNTAE